MARILVVEDERPIAELVRLYLHEDGHSVHVVTNGVAALEVVDDRASSPDLIILDLMLPGLDGRGVCRRIRSNSNVPIIMLTALDDARDKIEGLGLGADDYVTKPFDPAELCARVKAVLRRASITERADEPESEQNVMRVANLSISLSNYLVEVDGAEVQMPPKEFDLLVLFARHPNMVVTRSHLLSSVWGESYDTDSRTLDVHISRLRDRLASSGAQASIETARAVGYRFRTHTKMAPET